MPHGYMVACSDSVWRRRTDCRRRAHREVTAREVCSSPLQPFRRRPTAKMRCCFCCFCCLGCRRQEAIMSGIALTKVRARQFAASSLRTRCSTFRGHVRHRCQPPRAVREASVAAPCHQECQCPMLRRDKCRSCAALGGSCCRLHLCLCRHMLSPARLQQNLPFSCHAQTSKLLFRMQKPPAEPLNPRSQAPVRALSA